MTAIRSACPGVDELRRLLGETADTDEVAGHVFFTVAGGRLPPG